MATTNPFDLLGDDENDDPSQLIAAAQKQQKLAAPKKPQAPAKVIAAATAPKLPARPPPPSEAVKESKNETGLGGGRGGRGRGRGFNRDSANGDNTFHVNNRSSGGYRASEDGDNTGRPDRRYSAPRGAGIDSGRRGGYHNGEVEGERSRRGYERRGGSGEVEDVERPRRVYERRSGTGRGSEMKREGAGRGNWGSSTDEISPEAEELVNESEKIAAAEKQPGEGSAVDARKDNPENEPEQKEPEAEDKEMTLEEYEKLLEEKRKVLQSLKTEERKVDVDKEFESMQQLSSKKDGADIFIKLGSEKDKRKEAADKEDRVKKSVNINEFLKPAEGEKYYSTSGRGRGRGRGRGAPVGGYSASNTAAAPAIEDPRQFPSLSGK